MHHIGENYSIGLIKKDARSLDCSSHDMRGMYCMGMSKNWGGGEGGGGGGFIFWKFFSTNKMFIRWDLYMGFSFIETPWHFLNIA